MNVAKIGLVTVILCLGADVNFCPHILYILTDFGEIRTRACGRSSCEFRENLWS